MRLKELRHGHFGKPHFRRWSSFVQRCFNPKNTNYAVYGARGITIADVWSPLNPEGANNFITWMTEHEQQFFKNHPEHRGKRIEVGRLDIDKGYSPENCVIRPFASGNQKRRHVKLTERIVIKMRQHKKREPKITLRELRDTYCKPTKVKKRVNGKPTTVLVKLPLVNISRALRGITWKTVDAIEAPIQK